MKKIYVFIITVFVSLIPFILRMLKLQEAELFNDVSIKMFRLFMGATTIRFFMCWVIFVIGIFVFKK